MSNRRILSLWFPRLGGGPGAARRAGRGRTPAGRDRPDAAAPLCPADRQGARAAQPAAGGVPHRPERRGGDRRTGPAQCRGGADPAAAGDEAGSDRCRVRHRHAAAGSHSERTGACPHPGRASAGRARGQRAAGGQHRAGRSDRQAGGQGRAAGDHPAAPGFQPYSGKDRAGAGRRLVGPGATGNWRRHGDPSGSRRNGGWTSPTGAAVCAITGS